MSGVRWRILVEGIAGAVFMGVTILLAPLLRRWYSHWGATQADILRALPGDNFVPHPKSELDCAILIHASAAAIWPWLVQIGCQRGGWYSYDLLDNGGVPSAEAVLPKYQELKVGDTVKAVPNGSFGFPVAVIEPGRALSLAGVLNARTGQPADPNQPMPDVYFAGDQTFFLEPIDDQTTRLVFRMRMDWNRSLLNNLAFEGLVDPISFVSGRKMLLNLKARIERAGNLAS